MNILATIQREEKKANSNGCLDTPVSDPGRAVQQSMRARNLTSLLH
jgi:hypothetical protein